MRKRDKVYRFGILDDGRIIRWNSDQIRRHVTYGVLGGNVERVVEARNITEAANQACEPNPSQGSK